MKYYSYAKINLALEILNRYSDGFHEIKSVIQPVSLSDEIEIKTAGEGIELIAPPSMLPKEENLIYKAVRLLSDYCQIKPALAITIQKHIPVGAGLGGGSSNAATTLSALNHFLNLNLSYKNLKDLGIKLGCDVPFFLKPGLNLVQGKGEILTALNRFPSFYIILVFPGFSISTPWAYNQFDILGTCGEKGKVNLMLSSLEQNNLQSLSSALYNDFEPVIFKTFPKLQEIKFRLIELGCQGALMSGSGSSIFGLINDLNSANNIMQKLSALEKVQVFLAESL